jgi:hypothetical protein
LEFLWVLLEHLKEILQFDALKYHVVLMIDKSTDQNNVTTFDNLLMLFEFNKKGSCNNLHVELLAIEDVTRENMYLTTTNLLKRLQRNHTNQLVALAINGATFMIYIGCHRGLTTRLRHDVLALVSTHCIAN